MVKVEVEIGFSEQAELMLKNMLGLDKKSVIAWFVKNKGVKVSGGDVVDFLDANKVVNR